MRHAMVDRKLLIVVLLVTLFGVLAFATVAQAGSEACEKRVNNTFDKLLECVTLEGVREHQAAFQAIANANNGIRTSGTPGYDASVDYVKQRMEAAGYEVTIQPFDYPFFEELGPAELEQVSPNPTIYVYFGFPSGFATMSYSGSGDVTASAEGVDIVDVFNI